MKKIIIGFILIVLSVFVSGCQKKKKMMNL